MSLTSYRAAPSRAKPSENADYSDTLCCRSEVGLIRNFPTLLSAAFPRGPRRHRRPLVQLADPATQAEVGQRKHVGGFREQLHLPTRCGSRIDADVASILT